MARIRTIKPEFFRHEGLQELEKANPGAYVMLTFAGLWGHCDKSGTFAWKPRSLKLDILPFLDFDMETTLGLLVDAGLVNTWEALGKHWGNIGSFTDHQRITGKEAQAKSSFPQAPEFPQGHNGEASGNLRGNTRETPVKHPGAQEGTGIGREGKEEGNRALDTPDTNRTCSAPATDAEWQAWEDELKATFPRYRPDYHASDWGLGLRNARRLVDIGKLDARQVLDLAAEYRTYADSVIALNAADAGFLVGPANFFDPMRNHWQKRYPVKRSKSEATEDANIAEGQAFLAASGDAA
jgi:hypothetical protein